MSRLFDIAENYRELFDTFDDCDDLTDDQIEAYFDTLEGIEDEFSDKAENIACFIKELTVEADAMEAEAKALTARAKVKRNLITRLKNMLLTNMQACGIKKIDRTRAKISLRSNAESVSIPNDAALIPWLMEHAEDCLVYKAPEISKSKVKAALQDGREIPGAELVRTVSVIIK